MKSIDTKARDDGDVTSSDANSTIRHGLALFDDCGEYDLKEAFSESKKKGVAFYLDGFTASAIVKVYEAVANEIHRSR